MKHTKLRLLLFWSFLLIATTSSSFAQKDTIIETLQSEIKRLTRQIETNRHRFDVLVKKIDDNTWFHRVGDVAYIDKVRLTSTPRWKAKKPNDRFADNKIRFYSYVFIPKTIDISKKYPLIVLPHSGIHSNFSTYHTHIIRELMAQEYIVVSAEYRGSTGYGRGFYEDIDYGGRENDDVLESRNYMIENYSFVDDARVGVMGWSHGGMIALMQILQQSDKYKCAFAGVPVSDLENRLASHSKGYTRYFTASYHIGESIDENPEEYKRRSPTTYAKDLDKPLMIYTNTNDDDVYVEEVELMIETLKKHDKDFRYKIFKDASGGHSFDRLDSKEATDIRFTIYEFMAEYLKPNKPFRDTQEMRKAGYMFN